MMPVSRAPSSFSEAKSLSFSLELIVRLKFNRTWAHAQGTLLLMAECSWCWWKAILVHSMLSNLTAEFST
jgi:hypothetical protein